ERISTRSTQSSRGFSRQRLCGLSDLCVESVSASSASSAASRGPAKILAAARKYSHQAVSFRSIAAISRHGSTRVEAHRLLPPCRRRDQSMAHADVWWHRHWVRVTESVLAHTAAIVVGFAMMVVGLGLGVTIIMLPAGLVIGLLG